MSIEQIFLVIIGIWLLILSLGVVFLLRLFTNLTKGVKKGNLIKLLDNVVDKEAKNAKGIAGLAKEVKRLEGDIEFHVQKVGLVRFNPFNEMGGDHSFSLSLLDGRDNGVILTGLHTRERTRVYIKKVTRGKSKYDLSREESKALLKARKVK
ncbi:MAG: DUF4446 family protein [Patescibacteria group bacterium]